MKLDAFLESSVYRLVDLGQEPKFAMNITSLKEHDVYEVLCLACSGEARYTKYNNTIRCRDCSKVMTVYEGLARLYPEKKQKGLLMLLQSLSGIDIPEMYFYEDFDLNVPYSVYLHLKHRLKPGEHEAFERLGIQGAHWTSSPFVFVTPESLKDINNYLVDSVEEHCGELCLLWITDSTVEIVNAFNPTTQPIWPAAFITHSVIQSRKLNQLVVTQPWIVAAPNNRGVPAVALPKDPCSKTIHDVMALKYEKIYYLDTDIHQLPDQLLKLTQGKLEYIWNKPTAALPDILHRLSDKSLRTNLFFSDRTAEVFELAKELVNGGCSGSV